MELRAAITGPFRLGADPRSWLGTPRLAGDVVARALREMVVQMQVQMTPPPTHITHARILTHTWEGAFSRLAYGEVMMAMLLFSLCCTIS